jgi:Galactose oxidase, central domain
MLPIAAVDSSLDGMKRRRIGSRGSWSEMVYGGGRGTNDIPCPRSMHVGVVWCDVLYIYGGRDETNLMNDLHTFQFGPNLWKTITTDM